MWFWCARKLVVGTLIIGWQLMEKGQIFKKMVAIIGGMGTML
jgi:hypothetical protein